MTEDKHNFNYPEIKNNEAQLGSIDNKLDDSNRRNVKTSGNAFLRKYWQGRRERPSESLGGLYFNDISGQFQTAGNNDQYDTSYEIDKFSNDFSKELIAAKFSNKIKKDVRLY